MPRPVNPERDAVIAAAFDAAWAAPPGELRRAAIRRLLFIHTTWPLIEYMRAIERAEQVTADVQLLRDTWPQK